MSEKLQLYGFYYNPCVHESATAMVSLHYSENGANDAMEKFKKKLKRKPEDWERFLVKPAKILP